MESLKEELEFLYKEKEITEKKEQDQNQKQNQSN